MPMSEYQSKHDVVSHYVCHLLRPKSEHSYLPSHMTKPRFLLN